MATPTRIGMQKARRKQYKWTQDHKKEESKQEEISEEEHKKRLDKLKEMGLIK